MKQEFDTSMPVYLFHQGTNYKAYDLLGCHIGKSGNSFTYVFRVWAPNAETVSVIGDFSSWDTGLPMQKISAGVWEAKFKSEKDFSGTFYKYRIKGKNGVKDKSDPYAVYSQTLTSTASVIFDLSSVSIKDSAWMKKRSSFFSNDSGSGHYYPSPMNIYELHLASWRTKDGKATDDGEHYLNYREIADSLVPYVKEMGYTHVELLPITEYPYDGSWGYQVCGYYAPTSRFGSPNDFAYFVEKLHKNGIGLILDWVPAHFPKDSHGLYEFDGSPLYEYQGKDRMENKGWGTRYFDVGREEVQSFLISNALFWMRTYHADGLRIDAVASMLYLDYDREPGEWVPNTEGNNHNLEAIAFFRKLNAAVYEEFPDVLMIAEESTAWPMITKPVSDGGLGFSFKWNMGFANDMFSYVAKDPIYRQYDHTKLTFPMMYAFDEHYVLPVSHDEVVHGKCSLYNKMFGSYDEKFAMMRSFLTFLMTQPGKKLTFMGTEFAQVREWDYQNELEWFMLKYPRHTEMQRFVKTLNRFYLSHPELWEIDDGWDGFGWIDADRANDNAVIYNRYDTKGKSLTVIINFSPNNRPGYEFPVEHGGKYRVLLNSDLYEYGGTDYLKDTVLKTVRYKNGRNSVSVLHFDLPAYSALILQKTSNSFGGQKNEPDYSPAIIPSGVKTEKINRQR